MITLMTIGWWFLIGSGIVAYLCIGNLLGKAVIDEYLNDTDTAQLKWYQRIKRRLLFPMTASEWAQRARIILHCPIDRLNSCDTGVWKIKEVEDRVDVISRIIRLNIFLWPILRWLSCLIGVCLMIVDIILTLAFHVSNIVLRFVDNILGKASGGMMTASYTSPEAVKIVTFIEKNILPQKTKLRSQCQEHQSKRDQLNQVISRWRNLLNPTLDPENRCRIEAVVAQLKIELKQHEDAWSDINSAIEELDTCERRLNEIVSINHLFIDTAQVLSALPDGSFVESERNKAIEFAQEAMRIATEISDAPRGRILTAIDLRQSTGDGLARLPETSVLVDRPQTRQLSS